MTRAHLLARDAHAEQGTGLLEDVNLLLLLELGGKVGHENLLANI